MLDSIFRPFEVELKKLWHPAATGRSIHLEAATTTEATERTTTTPPKPLSDIGNVRTSYYTQEVLNNVTP